MFIEKKNSSWDSDTHPISFVIQHDSWDTGTHVNKNEGKEIDEEKHNLFSLICT